MVAKAVMTVLLTRTPFSSGLPFKVGAQAPVGGNRAASAGSTSIKEADLLVPSLFPAHTTAEAEATMLVFRAKTTCDRNHR